MKTKNTLFLLILIVLLLLFSPLRNVANPSFIYAIPPVNSFLVLVDDYLYFLTVSDVIKKYGKNDLIEVDSLSLDECHGIVYSEYLDKLIAVGGAGPFYVKMIDYQNMEVVDEYNFIDGEIGDFAATEDKLYIAWDDSDIGIGDFYNPGELPQNTGVLSEYNIDTMVENWRVNVATFPTGIGIGGDHVIVSAKELGINYERLDYPYVEGSIVSVVNRNTREVYQFQAGYGGTVPGCYHGSGKYYICNVFGVYNVNEYGGMVEPGMGLSILNLNDTSVEHFMFETADLFDHHMSLVSHATCDSDYLYLAYTDSVFEGNTYFGRFDISSMMVENIIIPGIEQFLVYVLKDGNNLYFVTYDGWLIKYTLD